jgi:geranylgeranyl diphosphate synthase type 3
MVQYTSKKGFADDLTEGKFSFPVIHGIHADTSNNEILGALLRVLAF